MERYREVVKQINTLNLHLQQRVKRCHYLRQRVEAYRRVNPEQAEAYYQRLNWHKPKLCDTMEQIADLEEELRHMPREWIV